MKKTTLAVLLVALLALTAACSAGPDPQNTSPSIPEWTLTVVMSSGEEQFRSKDAAALTPVTVEAATKNKNGEISTNTYTGVKLADILRAVGVSDFSGVTVYASDGFSADYDQGLAMADDTVLAWEKDGEVIHDDPPLQMAPTQGAGNQFVKSVTKIAVY